MRSVAFAVAACVAFSATPAAAQQKEMWTGAYLSVEQSATNDESPMSPADPGAALAFSRKVVTGLKKEIAVSLDRNGAYGSVSYSHRSMDLSTGRALVDCKGGGPIQTFWSRGLTETSDQSQASGKAELDMQTASDGAVTLSFSLPSAKGESRTRSKSYGGITCWGPPDDPGQDNREATDEDGEEVTVDGVPDRDGVIQGREETPTENGRIVARWYFRRGGPDCLGDSIALEMARDLAASTARETEKSYLEVAGLLNALLADPIVAQVNARFSAQQSRMISAFAAREAARADARDAANSAYGEVVAIVADPQQTDAALLTAAGIPAANGAPPDPRFPQLSLAMSQFVANAQMLKTWLGEVEKYRKRFEDCRKR